MPLQPPRHIASAEAIDRLATVRALPKLIIGIPPNKIRGRSRPQPSAKPLSEQQLRLMPRFGFVFSACYVSLKKALTPLLDRIGTRPYSGRTVSTPKARLPKMLAPLRHARAKYGPHSDPLSTATRSEKRACKGKPYVQIQISSAARPCRGQAHRCRRKDQRRHHHSRHRQGEAVAGRNHGGRPGRPR